jgi:hypothetical protein
MAVNELEPKDQPEDQRFAAAVRRALRDSEAVDAATALRLSAARRRAMDAAQPRQRMQAWAWGVPAAMAVALLAWVVVPRLLPVPEATPVNLVMLDALEWAEDDLDSEIYGEIYEDLDLYEALDDPGV